MKPIEQTTISLTSLIFEKLAQFSPFNDLEFPVNTGKA